MSYTNKSYKVFVTKPVRRTTLPQREIEYRIQKNIESQKNYAKLEEQKMQFAKVKP